MIKETRVTGQNNIREIEESRFHEVITASGKPVVVDLWMENCPPCDVLEPKLKAIADNFREKAMVYKLKVDEKSDVVRDFDVKAAPTVLFFNNGELVNRLSGLIDRETLQEAFSEVATATD